MSRGVPRGLINLKRVHSKGRSKTKPTRKTTISSKDTEVTTNDARVHNSRGEDAAIEAVVVTSSASSSSRSFIISCFVAVAKLSE